MTYHFESKKWRLRSPRASAAACETVEKVGVRSRQIRLLRDMLLKRRVPVQHSSGGHVIRCIQALTRTRRVRAGLKCGVMTPTAKESAVCVGGSATPAFCYSSRAKDVPGLPPVFGPAVRSDAAKQHHELGYHSDARRRQAHLAASLDQGSAMTITLDSRAD